MMFHPCVTAPPGTNTLSATFELYLADAETGQAVPGSESGPLVFQWTTVPDGRPALDIARKVVVAWPIATSGYVLESADTPNGAVWMTVTNAPTEVDGRTVVVLGPEAATRFYRLRRAP